MDGTPHSHKKVQLGNLNNAWTGLKRFNYTMPMHCMSWSDLIEVSRHCRTLKTRNWTPVLRLRDPPGERLEEHSPSTTLHMFEFIDVKPLSNRLLYYLPVSESLTNFHVSFLLDFISMSIFLIFYSKVISFLQLSLFFRTLSHLWT